MLTAEFDDLVNRWSRIQMVHLDFVEGDVLVTSLLWINENPNNFRRWKFLLTWIIVLLMDVDSRIWWLGENALTVDQESKWYQLCRGWCASNLSPLINENPNNFSKMEISTYLNYCITHGCWQPNLIMTWWNALTVWSRIQMYHRLMQVIPLDKWEPPIISRRFSRIIVGVTHGCMTENLIGD